MNEAFVKERDDEYVGKYNDCPACGAQWTVFPDRSMVRDHTNDCAYLSWLGESDDH